MSTTEPRRVHRRRTRTEHDEDVRAYNDASARVRDRYMDLRHAGGHESSIDVWPADERRRFFRDGDA